MENAKRKSIYSMLIKLQLEKELLGSGLSTKRKKVRSFAGTVLIYILLAILLAGSFGAMFMGIAAGLYGAGLGWLYMAIMGIMVIFMTFMIDVFLVQNQMFESKDNDLLLSMPVKPRAILISRIAGLLMLSYGYAAVIALPALIIYIYSNGISILGILFFLIELLILPMFGLTLAMLVGWTVGTIVSKSGYKKILQTVLTLVGVTLYLVIYTNLSSGAGELLEKAVMQSESLISSLPILYHFGNAITGPSIVSLLIDTAICIIPFALCCYLVSINFSKILSGKKGEKRIEYKAGRMASRGSLNSMTRLEFNRFFSSPTYMLNGAMGLIMMVVMPIIVIFQIKAGGDDEELGIDIGTFLGNFEITPAIVTLIMLFILTFVIISGPTVSLDAKTLWILKSGPVEGNKVLMSKTLPHVLISIPFVIISAIILEEFLKLDIVYFIEMLIILLLATFVNALGDTLVGTKFPKMDWLTETEAVKKGRASILSMVINAILPLAFICLFLLLRKFNMFSIGSFMGIMLGFYLMVAVGLYYIIRSKGNQLINNLEI